MSKPAPITIRRPLPFSDEEINLVSPELTRELFRSEPKGLARASLRSAMENFNESAQRSMGNPRTAARIYRGALEDVVRAFGAADLSIKRDDKGRLYCGDSTATHEYRTAVTKLLRAPGVGEALLEKAHKQLEPMIRSAQKVDMVITTNGGNVNHIDPLTIVSSLVTANMREDERVRHENMDLANGTTGDNNKVSTSLVTAIGSFTNVISGVNKLPNATTALLIAQDTGISAQLVNVVSPVTPPPGLTLSQTLTNAGNSANASAGLAG